MSIFSVLAIVGAALTGISCVGNAVNRAIKESGKGKEIGKFKENNKKSK